MLKRSTPLILVLSVFVHAGDHDDLEGLWRFSDHSPCTAGQVFLISLNKELSYDVKTAEIEPQSDHISECQSYIKDNLNKKIIWNLKPSLEDPHKFVGLATLAQSQQTVTAEVYLHKNPNYITVRLINPSQLSNKQVWIRKN